ncbi:MAG: secretion system protein, partial [Candidatus Accumulibacter sp.]|nr:secretion system protein [Accumulibacter sp.]
MPDSLAQQVPGTSLRLGERLLEQGVLTQWQFQYALQKQAVEHLRLGKLLVLHGLAREHDIAVELATRKNIPFVAQDRFPRPDAEALAHFNRELCLVNGFLPIRRVENSLEVLLGDGDEAKVGKLVLHRAGLACRFMQGEFSRVSQYIREAWYFAQHSVDALLEQE